MSRFHVRTLAAAALIGATGAMVGLSVAPAEATVTASPVGVYTSYTHLNGETPFACTLTVEADGHFTVGGGPHGTWSVRGHTIVFHGMLEGQSWDSRATVEANGFGTKSHPGTISHNGKPDGTWYAVRDTTVP